MKSCTGQSRKHRCCCFLTWTNQVKENVNGCHLHRLQIVLFIALKYATNNDIEMLFFCCLHTSLATSFSFCVVSIYTDIVSFRLVF